MVHTVVKDRSEEAREIRNRLIWAACLQSWTRMSSQPGLLPEAMFGSMVLLHQGSVLRLSYFSN